MHMSLAGVALLKIFEGCRLQAYDDGAGVWTIGYGHTKGVKPGDSITVAEAERLLREDDLPVYEKAVDAALSGPIGTSPTPTQNQFDAMVSLCFNIGPAKFAKSSVARRFRQGNTQGAADAFLMWNKAGKPLRVLPGLDRRRRMERDLFLKPDAAPAPPAPPPAQIS